MRVDQISALLASFLDRPLSDQQLRLLAIYLDLLMKWNSRVNLTAIRDPAETVTRHFGESLFAARHLIPDPSTAGTAFDIGSGAGFPGLLIKIWAPQLTLSLIESNQKKSVFLREAVRSLALTGVNVLQARAESVSAKADVVTLRAVERFGRILPTASHLLSRNATIALLIGTNQVETAKSILPTIRWHLPIPIPLSERRILLLGNNWDL